MKRIFALTLVLVLAFSLIGCAKSGDSKTVRIGASPTPHKLILKYSAPRMEEQGINLEITETAALDSGEAFDTNVSALRESGFSFSMDDFGTGYSSLSYIQILPITVLKLDRSFIMYLEDDAISREIVSAVIRIAKSKKIETIAEGIETIGQAHILRESGSDQSQGLFFGKPMPAD